MTMLVLSCWNRRSFGITSKTGRDPVIVEYQLSAIEKGELMGIIMWMMGMYNRHSIM